MFGIGRSTVLCFYTTISELMAHHNRNVIVIDFPYTLIILTHFEEPKQQTNHQSKPKVL